MTTTGNQAHYWATLDAEVQGEYLRLALADAREEAANSISGNVDADAALEDAVGRAYMESRAYAAERDQRFAERIAARDAKQAEMVECSSCAEATVRADAHFAGWGDDAKAFCRPCALS